MYNLVLALFLIIIFLLYHLCVEFKCNNIETFNTTTTVDSNLENEVTLPSSNILNPITNYEYELKIEDDKRNIFVLKPQYLNVMFNDLEEIMTYKKGSTQYVSRTLKKGDNIRLY